MLHDFSRELELSDRLETNYLRILYYDFSQNYSDSYHSYEYTRLCTILSGEKHISVNQTDKFKYDNNKFLLLPPKSNVFMTINEPTRALVFELSDDLIKCVSENVSLEYNIDYDTLVQDRLLCAKESLELKDVFGKIHKLIGANDKNIKYILDLYAQELVFNLVQIKGVHQLLTSEPDNPINRAINIMKEEYMLPLSIAQISSDLNLSEAYFCQYFKKVTGITPKEFLTNIKMEKAKEMILHSSVTDTAFDLGYENVSHFIALFKNKYGVTPKQFKKYPV